MLQQTSLRLFDIHTDPACSPFLQRETSVHTPVTPALPWSKQMQAGSEGWRKQLDSFGNFYTLTPPAKCNEGKSEVYPSSIWKSN